METPRARFPYCKLFGCGASASKRRKVSHATFLKWKVELDKECHTMSWLECETAGVGTEKRW